MNKKLLLFLLGFLLMTLSILLVALDGLSTRRFGVINESVLVTIPIDELPEHTLYISYDRRGYQRGEMTLVIPAIDVFTPIGESTEPERLKEMPGLYEFADLPREGDVNTSIAGHRDIYDMAFYSLDRLQSGDFLYLLHKGNVYQYEFVDMSIVKPDNWGVILPQGYSCLTLTTCDPIGTTWNRLVVRGRMRDKQVYSDAYPFVVNAGSIA